MPFEVSMLQPVWLTEADYPAWDALAAAHPRAVVANLSGWMRAVERAFPHIRGRVLALRDRTTGNLVAGLPLYDARSWLMGRRIISVPFGTLCEPVMAQPEFWPVLAKEIHKFAEEVGASRIQIRALQPLPMGAECGFEVSTVKHHYLDLTPPEAVLLNSFSRMAVRKRIQHAVKSGIVVRPGLEARDWLVFDELFTRTRIRLALPPIPRRIFGLLWQHLGPRHCGLFIATAEAKPVGALFYTVCGGCLVLEHSGCDIGSRASGVLQLLYWEAIQLAKKLGCVRCSFGRTPPDQIGLIEHKRHWATVEEDVPVLGYPPSGEAKGFSTGSSGYKIARWLLQRVPHPAARLLGHFAYRHWA